jgi:hypothetical protein
MAWLWTRSNLDPRRKSGGATHLFGPGGLAVKSEYHSGMIRQALPTLARPVAVLAGLSLLVLATPTLAQSGTPGRTKPAASHASPKTAARPKPTEKGGKAAKPEKTEKKSAASAKPVLVGTFGDWGAYLAQQGKSKTCYALGQPKDRNPPGLKRDPAYIFISTRPAENVHDEVSIAAGFDVKATPEPKAEVGAASFDLVAKGPDLWVKNAAEEEKLLAAMRRAGKLVVRASSLKGNVTVDSYSLTGLSQALDRVKKDCR